MKTPHVPARGISEIARALLVVLALGCNKKPTPSSATPDVPKPASEAPHPAARLAPESSATAAAPDELTTPARLGAPAPDFELVGIDGKKVSLKEHLGKVVVLEWFNPGCPFVQKSHTQGSLVDTASRHMKAGVVWLAINSGAPGKQGHGVETNQQGAARFRMTHPVLLDEGGSVGRAYGATNTPHLFIIDAKGTLVYQGAIDNSPDGEGESPEGGRLVNYVDQALAEIAQGKPVSVPDTKAYGCSVKYGS